MASHLQAELASLEQLGSLLDCTIPQGWPPGEYDESAQRFFYERLVEGGIAVVGWYGWYAIVNQDAGGTRTLIATGGFLGPPSDAGTIEVGYSVVPAWQGQGYAKEMIEGLIGFAFENSRVKRIIAHTTKENIASCKVLERLGFSQSKDEQKHLQIQYELLRARVPA
jgi:RimJ/RimL family protein N-acetyltransferase